MSAHRIISTGFSNASKATAPIKRKDYLSWLHDLPCIVSLRHPVEAAHLSEAMTMYGHLGRGKGRKASDRWAVPLCKQKHDEQHQGKESDFWKRSGVNPYVAALTLWGLWSDLGEDATDIAVRLIVSREIGRVQ